jgi:polysaccharide biosynthesis protein PslG
MQKIRLFTLMLLAAVVAACGGTTAEPEPVLQATQPPPAEVVEVAPTPTLAVPATLPPPIISGSEDAPPPVVVEEPAVPIVLPPWPADQFGYGVQSHAIIGDPAFTAEVVKNQLGMDWVKVQLEWWLVAAGENERQWFFYDGIVDEASKRGLYLMFSVVGTPDWMRSAGNHIGPPDDYNEMAKFLTELIARYPNQIHAIEVWNEMNLDREWQTANGISPEDYVEFLRVSHGAIKAADPNIIVISGALSPTGPGDWVRWADDFEYMDRALAAGMLNYADCVGAHHNGYNIAPDVAFDQTGSSPNAATAQFRGPFDNPHHSWSFKTTIDTYAEKVQAYNPTMKLCVTEFGWATTEGYDTYPQGFEFARDNSLEEQATYLVQAFNQMRNSGDVWLAYVFNYDFGNKGGGPTDDVVPYSIVDTNGIPRPAFAALAEMEKVR